MKIICAPEWLPTVQNYGWRLVMGLGVWIIGIVFVRCVGRIVRHTLRKGRIDGTLVGFTEQAIKVVLWILLLFAVLAVLGIPLTPLVTLLASAGLALSLAIKDSLSNLAGGILMMGTKPFAEGDYVEIDGTGGTVRHIHLLTSELVTPDNKKVLLPNGVVNNARIVNFSARSTRRVEFRVSVAYGTDLRRLRSVVSALLRASPYTLSEPAPALVFTGAEQSALVFSARIWVKREAYWDAYWEVGEQLVQALPQAGIEIPYEKLDVMLRQTKREDSTCE